MFMDAEFKKTLIALVATFAIALVLGAVYVAILVKFSLTQHVFIDIVLFAAFAMLAVYAGSKLLQKKKAKKSKTADAKKGKKKTK